MLRTVLAMFACLVLAACSGWESDRRLFGDGDWAHLDINGRYKSDIDESAERATVKTLPNGLIEARSRKKGDKGVSLIGLVPIKGGSGEYFLMVDRSDDSKKDDQYFIAYVPDGKTLKFYMPDCNATSSVEGMAKMRDDRWGVKIDEETLVDQPPTTLEKAPQTEPEDQQVCKFSTKDALMAAGLEAEKFLSERHIVAVTPFASFSPDDEADKPSAKKRPTRRPPPRRSHP